MQQKKIPTCTPVLLVLSSHCVRLNFAVPFEGAVMRQAARLRVAALRLPVGFTARALLNYVPPGYAAVGASPPVAPPRREKILPPGWGLGCPPPKPQTVEETDDVVSRLVRYLGDGETWHDIGDAISRSLDDDQIRYVRRHWVKLSRFLKTHPEVFELNRDGTHVRSVVLRGHPAAAKFVQVWEDEKLARQRHAQLFGPPDPVMPLAAGRNHKQRRHEQRKRARQRKLQAQHEHDLADGPAVASLAPAPPPPNV